MLCGGIIGAVIVDVAAPDIAVGRTAARMGSRSCVRRIRLGNDKGNGECRKCSYWSCAEIVSL